MRRDTVEVRARTGYMSRFARREGDNLSLEIEDNGIGLDQQFADAAQGYGLSLHSTMMAVVGGTLELESAPGHFTRIRLSLPWKEVASIVQNE